MQVYTFPQFIVFDSLNFAYFIRLLFFLLLWIIATIKQAACWKVLFLRKNNKKFWFWKISNRKYEKSCWFRPASACFSSNTWLGPGIFQQIQKVIFWYGEFMPSFNWTWFLCTTKLHGISNIQYQWEYFNFLAKLVQQIFRARKADWLSLNFLNNWLLNIP